MFPFLHSEGIARIFQDYLAVMENEIWNPVTKQFTLLDDDKHRLHIPRTYHSIGLLLKDGRVAAAGGRLRSGYLREDVSARR